MRLIDADELLKWISGQSKSPSCPENESAFGLRIMKHIDRMPSSQLEPCKSIEDILEYLDDVLHPIVSPDNWYVYAELHDMISDLASARSQNMCEGCKYLPRFCNEEPCVSCSNNYENKWKGETDGSD